MNIVWGVCQLKCCRRTVNSNHTSHLYNSSSNLAGQHKHCKHSLLLGRANGKIPNTHIRLFIPAKCCNYMWTTKAQMLNFQGAHRIKGSLVLEGSWWSWFDVKLSWLHWCGYSPVCFLSQSGIPLHWKVALCTLMLLFNFHKWPIWMICCIVHNF